MVDVPSRQSQIEQETADRVIHTLGLEERRLLFSERDPTFQGRVSWQMGNP